MEKEKDLSIRGVISTNPDFYQILQSDISEIIAGEKRKMLERRLILPLAYLDLRPVSELLSLRSDVGTTTHGTTNFTLETLSSEDFYGAMIGDRLRMMFNFITMKGESRRC